MLALGSSPRCLLALYSSDKETRYQCLIWCAAQSEGKRSGSVWLRSQHAVCSCASMSSFCYHEGQWKRNAREQWVPTVLYYTTYSTALSSHQPNLFQAVCLPVMQRRQFRSWHIEIEMTPPPLSDCHLPKPNADAVLFVDCGLVLIQIYLKVIWIEWFWYHQVQWLEKFACKLDWS